MYGLQHMCILLISITFTQKPELDTNNLLTRPSGVALVAFIDSSTWTNNMILGYNINIKTETSEFI